MVWQVSLWHRDAVHGHTSLLKQTNLLVLKHTSPFILIIPRMMSHFSEPEFHMSVVIKFLSHPGDTISSQRQKYKNLTFKEFLLLKTFKIYIHLKYFQKHIVVYCLAAIWENLWPSRHVTTGKGVNRQGLTCTNMTCTRSQTGWTEKLRVWCHDDMKWW